MPVAIREYPSGLVLWVVINNKVFETSSHKERQGAEVDENNLKKALQRFQVDLRVWKNFKRQEILNALRDLCEEVDRDVYKFSGLVILGASHGEERDNRDYLVASDGKGLLTETIVSLFHNDARIGLRDRPKCYLFNMCRGNNPNIRFEKYDAASLSLVNDTIIADATETKENLHCCGLDLSEDGFIVFEEDARRVHSEMIGSYANEIVSLPEVTKNNCKDEGVISFKKGDYMIVHSTLRGYVSNRHKYLGTIFVQELTKSIQELMRQENHSFEEVIRSACFASSSHQSSGENAPQVPEFITTLRAPFRFVVKGNFKNTFFKNYLV